MREIDKIEASEFDMLSKREQRLRLDFKKKTLEIRERFNLPGDFDVGTSGVVLVNKQPTEFVLDKEELEQLTKLDIEISKTLFKLEDLMFMFREKCDVPHFARLNAQYKWVNPDGSPVAVAEPPTE